MGELAERIHEESADQEGEIPGPRRGHCRRDIPVSDEPCGEPVIAFPARLSPLWPPSLSVTTRLIGSRLSSYGTPSQN
jgi:hypothetical protein